MKYILKNTKNIFFNLKIFCHLYSSIYILLFIFFNIAKIMVYCLFIQSLISIAICFLCLYAACVQLNL